MALGRRRALGEVNRPGRVNHRPQLADIAWTFHDPAALSPDEPERWLTSFRGEIRVFPANDRGPAEIGGSVVAHLFDWAGAMEHDVPSIEALDTSSDLAEFAELFDDEGALQSDLGDLGSSLLIGESITLDRRFRGAGVGLAVAACTLSTLGGGSCTTAVARASPIPRPENADDLRAARQALAAHWARVGYRPYQPGSNLLVYDLTPS